MKTLATLEGYPLVVAAVVLLGAALGRFAVSGLLGRYPATTLALTFSLVRLAALGLTRPQLRIFGLDGYGLLYVLTQPILWVLYFLVILELYSRALEEFPGLRRLGQLVLFSALGAIGLACSSLMVLDQRAGIDPYPFLAYLALQERSVYIALSALAILLLFFASHYRLPVRRNLLVLWACFGGYFVWNAALLSLRFHLGADFRPARILLNAVAYDAAVLGVTLFVSRAGETEIRRVRPLWGAGDRNLEAAVSHQLQSFNEALVKVLRS